ncbi:transglutaminase domain-containing protein [Cereibacter changlensis]|uniref:Transglutaminase domain-containing protein n=1 Tax=Cereibacter changlensis TaxID=402884 RepID=A0A4U0Z3Y4_9RHOB|nr:transglutaminase domain-containing protein [Cereibacter changlensis]TKA97171.1 transglutaminase domain-containing protein [Cereibacter changlensis]
MDRRTAMKIGAAASVAAFLPRPATAAFSPKPAGWRQFELTTRLEIPASGAPVQIWAPVPSVTEAGWMKAGESRWTTNAAEAGLKTDPVYGAAFVHAVFPASDAPAVLEIVSTVSTQDRAADLSSPGAATPLTEAERALYLSPTLLIPTDGIVRETSDQITAGASDDMEKARRLYDWIVENTARDPEVRGCGLGDVASMLEMGDLTGKCADLNALYVGLARAAGIPARDVYGLRVAPSAFGYKSLGAGSETVTKAQHCRAEVYLEGFGWVAVDPADVRKVMLEEPPKNLAIDDPKVADARAALFGSWEGNWIAYNFAHDVALPGGAQDPVEFLMYPQAEVDGEALDPLDPDAFAYVITAREITA